MFTCLFISVDYLSSRTAKCGFEKLCKADQEKRASLFDHEELAKLKVHPRIPLSAEFIQEVTQGMYFLM